MPDKPAEPDQTLKDEPAFTGIGVKRPLVPVVLALMAGLTAAAWGFEVPGTWLVAGLIGLLAVLMLLQGFSSVRGSIEQGSGGPGEPTGSGRDTPFDA